VELNPPEELTHRKGVPVTMKLIRLREKMEAKD
jgi:hypothetical protein